MEKEYKVSSISEFDSLIKTNKYLRVIEKEIIEKLISYQGFALIKEEEDAETLKTNIRITPCDDTKDFFYKIEIIKDNLNKYAKEGIEDVDNCTIEKLRNKLIRARKHFGNNWRGDNSYTSDKYQPFRSVLRTAIKDKIVTVSVVAEMIKSESHIIADKIEVDEIYYGPVFCSRLIKILNQEKLIKERIDEFLNCLIDISGQLYKKVFFDFELLNRGVIYDNIIIKTDSSFDFVNIDCYLVNVETGTVKLNNSVIDKIILSKGIEKVILKDVLTEKDIKLKGIKNKVLLQNVMTYQQAKKSKKEKIRDILIRYSGTSTSYSSTF